MKKFLSYLVIFTLIIIGASSSNAIDNKYKNNLLNVEMSQTPDNKVNVLLVFEKPYNEPVKVVYKSDNEYNILLPETYHSVTSVSTMNTLNIRSANVKLVPYFNQSNSNGYTKIVINTTRPVVFNANTSVTNPAKIAKNDLLDKLDKEESIKITPTKVQSQTKASLKTTATKPQTAKKTETAKTQAKASIPAQQTVKTNQAKTSAVKAAEPVNSLQNKQNETKAVSNPQPQAVVATTNQATQETTIENTREQEQNSNIEVQPANEKETPAASSETESLIEVPVNQLPSYPDNNIVLITLIAASIALIIVLLKGLNKTTPSYKTTYNTFTKAPETKRTLNIPESVQGLSWQEKYKFIKKQEEASLVTAKISQQNEISNELDNIYQTANSSSTNTIKSEKLNDIDYQPTESIIEEPTQNIENNDVPVYDYRLEEEPIEIVENIEEDAKNYDNTDNFEDLIQATDESELQLTEMSYEEPIIENNAPQDEEIAIEPETSHTSEEDNSQNDLDALVSMSVNKETDQQLPHANDSDVQTAPSEKAYTTNPLVTEIEPTLINQVKISKTKGFYLINYGNKVALVGYIKDEVFFIHSFTGIKPTFVQTRLTEKKRGADIYMVRTNNYKALVQVTKDDMKTLITL